MNERERFLRTMRFQPVDRFPLWGSLGLWSQTYQRWRKEGFPAITEGEFFGYDRQMTLPIDFGFVPPFEQKTVKETREYRIWIDEEGVQKKEFKKDAELSMPQFLEFPVKCREDFQELMFRMDPSSRERFPHNWDHLSPIYKDREIPLRLMGDRVAGFFGPLRGMMGLEKLLLTFYDDPRLIEEMMEAKLNLMMGIIKRALEVTDIDFFVFWEDMAYKTAPLLSPHLFKKYMVPRYRVITDYLTSQGVDIIMVDSDGNITELIPLWLEAGVNGFYPLEIQSGMDVVKLREKYGQDILLVGGIDKRVLCKSKKEIKQEVERRVSPIVGKGGYIPMIDHTVPPNVSFENYCYFIRCLKQYW